MIKTRLIGLVPDSKKFIAANVIAQWLGLCANVLMIFTIAKLLDNLRMGQAVSAAESGSIIAIAVIVRVLCVKLAASASYKPDMREKTRNVMRYSGPRMLFHHPCLAMRHVIESKKEKRKLP